MLGYQSADQNGGSGARQPNWPTSREDAEAFGKFAEFGPGP
jgi:hypothetical protein